jgi:glutamate-1-semialdehyde 2,1-aminomutase
MESHLNTAADRTIALDDAVAAAESRFAAANPQSRLRHERARAVLPGGHSRQTLYYSPFPLTIARGDGAGITDLDGHEYLNLVGDFAAGVFGHQCEPIQRAVLDTLRGGLSLSGPNTHEVEFAELISRRIPSMEQLRFCNSGSEACLFAAQLARHAAERPALLVFNGCYHGGFMSYGAKDPPLSVPLPLLKAIYNDVQGTRSALNTHAPSLAAVMVEPMMGSAGCIPATPEFLAMLREETQRIGALLIFDEVMTSRLAPGGVQELQRIKPDLTTLGKFWGGGFAFGAFGGSRLVMKHLDMRAGGTLSQGGTFNNNVMAMAAGLVGARDVYTADACRRLNALGDTLRQRLNELGESLGLGFQATGIGGVLTTHWDGARITHPAQVEAPDSPRRRLFHLEMLERGFYIARRGMINLSLPVQEIDIARFVQASREFLIRHAGIL